MVPIIYRFQVVVLTMLYILWMIGAIVALARSVTYSVPSLECAAAERARQMNGTRISSDIERACWPCGRITNLQVVLLVQGVVSYVFAGQYLIAGWLLQLWFACQDSCLGWCEGAWKSKSRGKYKAVAADESSMHIVIAEEEPEPTDAAVGTDATPTGR